MNQADIKAINQLLQTRNRNFNIFEAYSNYLNQCADYITPEMMKEMTGDYGLDELTAYQLLFAAAIGASEDEGDEARYYNQHYVKPSITHLNPGKYLQNDFYQHIHIPTKTQGTWQLGTESYKPYEAFIWRDIISNDQFEEIPQIGFFSEKFSFPAVMENGREWMSAKPNEVETIQPTIDAAQGKVVAFGLGLGYYAYMVSQKEAVESVTVVERDKNAIALFEEVTRPQMPHRDKINVVLADAFNYAKDIMPQEHFDHAFVDLWHDAADGVALYMRMKTLEKNCEGTVFNYWVEETLLSHIRWAKLLDNVETFKNGKMSAAEVKFRLTKEGILSE